MSDKKTQNQSATNNRDFDKKSKPYLDHGVASSVAMDNPDDSQLGADRTQTKDGQA
ncbi:MAG TPA: hypothetical protein VNT75_07875 [Symbiobacteriaceae bacterium]|nr:hypothetical protein [Symbiobacteriaceae bacterium]